jgi:hypothetical protein
MYNGPFQDMIRRIYDKFVDIQIDECIEKCRDDLHGMTRFVTWDVEDKGGSSTLYRLLPTPKKMVEIYSIAVERKNNQQRSNARLTSTSGSSEASSSYGNSDSNGNKNGRQLQQQQQQRQSSRVANGKDVSGNDVVSDKILDEWNKANNNNGNNRNIKNNDNHGNSHVADSGGVSAAASLQGPSSSVSSPETNTLTPVPVGVSTSTEEDVEVGHEYMVRYTYTRI